MSSALFAEFLSFARVCQTHGISHPWFHYPLLNEPRKFGQVRRTSFHHHVDCTDSGVPRTALIQRFPVVMAAATVLRLQTIVSREVVPTDAAVVTVGSLQAGAKENVIPDEAIIKLNVRTFDEDVRKHVLAAIERIVNAEAEASRAPKNAENHVARSLPACEE